jgi:Tfp pilus assembly protein PilZ
MKESQFIERRKEYRLPYSEKVIFTDGIRSATAYASNVSRGGLFVTTLDPFPIDTQVSLAFCLTDNPTSFCVKAKAAHIVFDRQRCEIECGMGFQFLELNEQQKSVLNLHILNQQSAYLEMKRVLSENRPDPAQIRALLVKLPTLRTTDLLNLRYKVNRICTIFEPAPTILGDNPRKSA